MWQSRGVRPSERQSRQPDVRAGLAPQRLRRARSARRHRREVHVAVRFTRYDERGAALASYPSLWIVTLVDGHWGVQARSTFAP
jgi:hypothetical protein